ncbi:MAG: monoamine oxidase [Algoriphagus sp.]|jgi:monoamine oxidase
MVLIIGGGLAGILTGYRLKKEGLPFKILEARNRAGGRIHTINRADNTPVEMGATWFTHQHKYLIALLKELELDYFEQHMDSSLLFQSSSTSPIQSIKTPSQQPSYRIAGGTSHLIETLLERLDKKDILLNQPVNSIKYTVNSVQVTANKVFEGHQVVLAIPPKLWSKRIIFDPKLPQQLIHIAQQTHTWMEDSIKVALTYDHPFWEDENLSGTFYSHSGPITELYDHCNHKRSKYALCGFINSSFKTLSYTERRSSVINHIKDVFGNQAEEFIDYEECVWSKEEYTFQATDEFVYPHQNNGNPIFSNSFFDNKLFISSSESAVESPGYMDGAVYAAHRVAQKIINTQL